MASQYSTSTDEISSQLHSSCTMALQPTHGNSTLKNAELEDESNIEEAAAVQLQCGQENVTLSLKQAQNQSMLILPDAKGQFSKKRNMQLLTTPKFDSNGTSHEPNTLLFTPTGILDPGMYFCYAQAWVNGKSKRTIMWWFNA